MYEERLKFQGRLAEAELEAKHAAISARGMIGSLRNLLDPVAPLDDLDPDQISDQALRLSNTLAEYREKIAKIAEIKRMLGR